MTQPYKVPLAPDEVGASVYHVPCDVPSFPWSQLSTLTTLRLESKKLYEDDPSWVELTSLSPQTSAVH